MITITAIRLIRILTEFLKENLTTEELDDIKKSLSQGIFLSVFSNAVDIALDAKTAEEFQKSQFVGQ